MQVLLFVQWLTPYPFAAPQNFGQVWQYVAQVPAAMPTVPARLWQMCTNIAQAAAQTRQVSTQLPQAPAHTTQVATKPRQVPAHFAW
ncbi:hypothetical protein [Deminuibacter soli]|uniref:Uncharacterized protein n=1 Tax=Deminuibacter soli TaxID=2291815 RepID=A0A3E1NMF1_9BACT|nr:hypothetical protein [Deminuibacter soli]RFM29110.1 hypothetical protein DXN05_10180 [Deminuibacter soli]